MEAGIIYCLFAVYFTIAASADVIAISDASYVSLFRTQRIRGPCSSVALRRVPSDRDTGYADREYKRFVYVPSSSARPFDPDV